MKHIFLNLKRFDVPAELGGVNRLAAVADWGRTIVEQTQAGLEQYAPEQVEFVQFFPEAHLPAAAAARRENSPVQIGCQGVFRQDVAPGGNFGAFTTNLPAAAAAALDSMDITYMVGSLAGDDTAFLLMRDTESAAAFCEEIKAML